jgi:hypothetical protein
MADLSKTDIKSLSTADALTAARAGGTITRTVEVQAPPLNGARFSFYFADAHGATPNKLRCIVSGGQLPPVDLVVEELADAEAIEGALAKLLVAAVAGA